MYEKVVKAKQVIYAAEIVNDVDCLLCTFHKNPDLYTDETRDFYKKRDHLLYRDLKNEGFHCSLPEHVKAFHEERPPKDLPPFPKWSCCKEEFKQEVESERSRQFEMEVVLGKAYYDSIRKQAREMTDDAEEDFDI